ncbi:MAG: amidohydrolase [Myxococcota bacterium]
MKPRPFLVPLVLALAVGADGAELGDEIERLTAEAEPGVIAMRHDFHAHPELSNREERTARVVAERLEALGLEVRRGVALTGVVGVLRGALPGPVVALRADMDALPVTEETGLPFASQVRTSYLGRDVGVMHACGHDAHVAIALGTAEVLAGLRDRLAGTVLFLFQPAEEGPPPGEEGGASRMLAEGAFDDPRPEAVFGLHVSSDYARGQIAAVPGGAMASSDRMRIVLRGRGTHAAYPWKGVDPIPVAARIVLAIEAIPAREVALTVPSVVSIGSIHGGSRNNILPDEVELRGTIRALDPEIRKELHARVRRIVTNTAEASGIEVDLTIDDGNPITWNDLALYDRMRPTLAHAAGTGFVPGVPRTGAEDFSLFAKEVPGLYFQLGVRDPKTPREEAAPNHSPRFLVDDGALALGVRAMAGLVVDYAATSGAQ